jgi:acetyl esterase/lipase
VKDNKAMPTINGKIQQYGTSSTGVALRWTAFEPPSGGKNPAVIVLHPGGFKTGAAGPLNVARDLAQAGFLALATEYRLAPPHTYMNTPTHPLPSQNTVNPPDDGHYPEQTTDVQLAIRAARKDKRCDGRVYGVGGSAGASHVAYMMATGTPGDDQFDRGVCCSGVYKLNDQAHLAINYPPGETNFHAACMNYIGWPDPYPNYSAADLNMLWTASPAAYVHAGMPSIFFMASTKDTGGVDKFQYGDLTAALKGVGMTETGASTPQIGQFKRMKVRVRARSHAFQYWNSSANVPLGSKNAIIKWLS